MATRICKFIPPSVRSCGSASAAAFSTSAAVQAKRSKRGKNVDNAAAAVEKPLLGRPSNNLKMGVVGLPNIGKSSLFNALTSSSVPAENYPFCTIEPSEARVHVPDSRFDWLCDVYKPAKRTPAHLTVLDIAGLVRGAAQGAGLGNAFLSNVASVDAIYHLVRVFENDDITHVEDTVDPLRDLDIIQDELRLKDEEMLERHINDLSRAAKQVASKKDQLAVVEKVANFMAKGNDVRKGDWNAVEVDVINSLHLLTAKPVVYLCNLNEDDYLNGPSSNPWIPKIQQWVDTNNKGDLVIPLSVSFESKLANMPREEASAFLEQTGATSQLPQIILAGYKSLGLIHYFTAGSDEVRAWTVRNFTKAPQAAGIIHTDFERGFISAEVMKFEDLYKFGNEANVRSAGKYLAKGRDYVVEDGDIMYFKFNVTGKKK